jgi:hypothetical protein
VRSAGSAGSAARPDELSGCSTVRLTTAALSEDGEMIATRKAEWPMVPLRRTRSMRQSGNTTWKLRMGEKKKKRPENQFRTTTSPLVVRHRINWPVRLWPGPRGDSPRVQAVSEKGRAGGRARRPARPLAGEPFCRGKTTVASGVVAYKLKRLVGAVFLSFLADHERDRVQTECQRGLRSKIVFDFVRSLAGFLADVSENLLSYVDPCFLSGNGGNS